MAASDRALAAEFAAARRDARDAQALDAQEHAALARRDACRDAGCVARWYADRRAALAATTARPPRLDVGTCVATRVTHVGSRLEDIEDSGSYLRYADGLSQVSYDVVPGMHDSRIGDPVRLCLKSRPKLCPDGDARGAIYAATNGRTGASWTAGDSSHVCGGA